MKHIHDVAQTSLKIGTHFEGHFTYDSKDLRIVTCTANEQQHSIIFQGLPQRALSQLDKHSEELALGERVLLRYLLMKVFSVS